MSDRFTCITHLGITRRASGHPSRLPAGVLRVRSLRLPKISGPSDWIGPQQRKRTARARSASGNPRRYSARIRTFRIREFQRAICSQVMRVVHQPSSTSASVRAAAAFGARASIPRCLRIRAKSSVYPWTTSTSRAPLFCNKRQQFVEIGMIRVWDQFLGARPVPRVVDCGPT